MKFRKERLELAAGLMWSCVGLLLLSYPWAWLKGLQPARLFLFLTAGLILAGLITAFGFSRLASANIRRIRNLPGEQHMIFRFQKWSSYPLIAVMITLGIYLRLYSPLPKPFLASLYLGIGGGLFASSFTYYRAVWQASRGINRD